MNVNDLHVAGQFAANFSGTKPGVEAASLLLIVPAKFEAVERFQTGPWGMARVGGLNYEKLHFCWIRGSNFESYPDHPVSRSTFA